MAGHLTIIRLAATLAATLLFIAGALPVAAARLALVIGNQTYATAVGPLHNPIKDADKVGKALNAAGFDVTYVHDLSRAQLLTAVEDYARQLDDGGDGAVGFLYYSGHGAAKPNTSDNYLIPVSLTDPNAASFWYDAVALDEIKAILDREAPSAAHIVVLDACRSELRLGRGGKSFVAVRSWPSVFLAFSTRESEIATDGDATAAAGPYALALSEEIAKARRTEIPVLFERVRTNFRQRAGGDDQFPEYHQGLTQTVYFDGAGRSRLAKNDPNACTEHFAADLWAMLEQAQSPGLVREFVRRCAGTASADLALDWLVSIDPSAIASLDQQPSPDHGTTQSGPSAGYAEPPPSIGLAALVADLSSEDTAVRRGARSALAAARVDALDVLMPALRARRVSDYRLELGATVALTEMLRADKSLRTTLSKRLQPGDLDIFVELSNREDRTLRVYASEFLYDLGDPRVVPFALARFPGASDNGKYNLALVLKGAAPYVAPPERARTAAQLASLKSSQLQKTSALIDEAIALLGAS